MVRFWFVVLWLSMLAILGTAGALDCDTITIAVAMRRFGVYTVVMLASVYELKDRLF